ncbi:hypothetical protein BC943DRAFT_319252 [Umbelopsis sp. AD052]|nr:hypothetical protein BC943DRAFT_319252 [Umbelopsis sp. AD052]
MLDNIVLHLHQEISLDGRKGTSLKRLWDITQAFLNNYADRLANASQDIVPKGFKPTLDDPFKARIWDALRYHPDIFVQMSDQPDSSRHSTPIKLEADTDMHAADDSYIDDDEGDIKAENNVNSLTAKYTILPGAKTLSLSDLIHQYGSSVSITTSKASQLLALTEDPHLKETDTAITQIALQVLEEAGRGREHGTTQIDLSRAFQRDSKTVFHFVKSMMNRGYLFKRPVVMRGASTQQVILTRYRHLYNNSEDDDDIGSHDVQDPFIDTDTEASAKFDAEATKKRISRCLESAPDKTLIIDDLKPLVGLIKVSSFLTRWFNRNLQILVKKGYIEKFLVPADTGKREYDRCIRLLKPYMGREDDGDQDDAELEPFLESKSDLEFLSDIPLAYQVYDMIRASGTQGLTSTHIHANIPSVSMKYLVRVLEAACVPGCKSDETRRLYRMGAMDGRKRFYLYYTRDAFTVAPELEKQTEKTKKAPFSEDEDQIGPEVDPFTIKTSAATAAARKHGTPGVPVKRGRPRKVVAPNDGDPTASSGPPAQPGKRGRPRKVVVPSDGEPSASPDPSAQLTKKRGRPKKVVVPRDSQPPASSVPAEDTAPIIQPLAPVDEHAAPVKTPSNDSSSTATESAASLKTKDKQPLAKKRKLTQEDQEGGDSEQLSEAIVVDAPAAIIVTEQEKDTSKSAKTLGKRTAEQDVEKETAKKSKEEPKKTRSTTKKGGVEKNRAQQQGGLMTWLKSAPSSPRQQDSATTPPPTIQPVTTEPAQPDDNVTQPMQVDQPVVAPPKTTNLKRGRAFRRIASGQSTPVAIAPLPERPVQRRMAKENSPSKEMVTTIFTATFPQKDAPDYIADQKVAPFPEHWKAISITKRNASQPYFIKRVEAVLQVMQSKKFAIFDKAFINVVSGVIDSNLTMASTGVLDRKSVMRATISCGLTGDLKIYPLEFKRLSGAVMVAALLLLPGTSFTDPELMAYITAYRETSYVPSGRIGPKPTLRTEERKVERLADRIKRLESSLENDDGANTSKRLQMLKTSKMALEVQGNTKKFVGTHSSMVRIAIRHGFILAKMVRAKIFMQCLRQMADAHRSNIVVTDNICRGMTLRAFAQVIGVFLDTPATREVLSNPHLLNSSLQLLDNKSKRAIWATRGQRLRSRVRSNLDVVHALGLIKPSVGDDVEINQQLSPAFILSDTAELRDYSQPGLPVVKVLPVRTMDEIEEYWRQLQTMCLKVVVFPDENTEDTEKRIEALKNEQSQLIHEKGYISGILSSPAWEGKFIYSEKQIKILDAYVDLELRRTPYDDPILCEEIAAHTELPIKRVQQYYRQVQAYKMRKKKRMRKFPRPGEENLVTADLTTVHIAPYKATPPWVSKRGRKSIIYRRNAQRIKNEHMADDENIPVVDQDDDFDGETSRQSMPKLVAPRLRLPWTANEDELLLYSYVIMKARRNIRWEPMRNVLPNRKPNSCRNRLSTLTRTQTQKARILKLVHAWQVVYRDALRSGKLTDTMGAKDKRDNSRVVNDVDDSDDDKDESYVLDQELVTYLTYFLNALRENPSLLDNSANFTIPATVDDLQAEYKVAVQLPWEDDKPLVDRWEDARGASFILKSRVLCSNTLCIRDEWTLGDLEMETSFTNQDTRMINDIKVMLKMILLTPGDKYNAKSAYQSLYRYPMELVSQAIRESSANNILTRAKYAGNSKTSLPTRSFGMTEKFLTLLAGTLPQRTFARATAYRHYLLNQDKINFSPTCSSGMIYCLLDMLAYDKAAFQIHNEEKYREKISRPYYMNRLTDTSKYEFQVAIDLAKDTPPPSVTDTIIGTFEEVDPQTWNTALRKFKSKNKHKVVELIADLLQKKEGDGISLIDLKRQLGAIGLTDQQLLLWIEKMRRNTPPLATYVGSSENILVGSSYVRSWAPRLRTSDQNDTGTLVPARMWYDIQGKTMEHVLRGCMQAVLEQIQRNPGITSSTILHKLKTLFVAGEVYDILRMLEQRQCVRSKPIAYPARTTLFSGPRMFHTQGT